MKYTYAYKTSDGQRHEAAMEAPSREVVFAELRKRGIRAIKVVAADGSKANGEVRGVRKRVVTLIAVAVAVIAGIAAFWLGRGRPPGGPQVNGALGDRALPFLSDTTRRQVIGDAAIIEKGIRTGWADVFEHEGDRFLASFAIPGVKAGVGTTSVAALEDALKERSPHRGDPTENRNDTVRGGRATSMKSPLGIEAQQIIAMVEGMKAEARAFVAAGGTVVEYGRMLVQRQEREIQYYIQAEREVDRLVKAKAREPEILAVWEARNASLRKMGIRLVPIPE